MPEHDTREPFLIQVYFGGKLSDQEVLNLMRAKLKETEERLAVYEAVYQMSQGMPARVTDPRLIFFSLLTLEIGYLNAKSEAAWLRSAIERVETKNYNIKIGTQS